MKDNTDEKKMWVHYTRDTGTKQMTNYFQRAAGFHVHILLFSKIQTLVKILQVFKNSCSI